MDGSPLILAQTHARKASKAENPTAAIGEHDLAAGQFATAAKGTGNSEAFRTLLLLEQHHEKLSQLLKLQNSFPVTPLPETTETIETKSASQSPPSQIPPAVQDGSPYRPQSQSFPAAHRPQRDISSSIASNLASARGIPSNRQRRSGQASSPVLAQQHAEGKILSPPRRSRLADTASKATREPSLSEKATPFLQPDLQRTATSSKEASSAPDSHPSLSSKPSKTDEPFQRFYSTFEALFSKLSAPLAFAGLPLSPDHDLRTPIPTNTSKTRNRVTADPDYSRLFSRAALRAVRSETGPTALAPAESFYVVPTTGGTLPYASILARHGAPSLSPNPATHGEDVDEFVDARETPSGPPSPHATRAGGKKLAGGKTMEELRLENEGLRAVLDEMSRRLWQFEMGAQMGSVALHQSIRANLQQPSPVASEAGGGMGDAEGKGGLEERVGALEEELGKRKKEMERMGKENEKLKGVVARYRERWEKLKEGARVRREGTGGGREEGDV